MPDGPTRAGRTPWPGGGRACAPVRPGRRPAGLDVERQGEVDPEPGHQVHLGQGIGDLAAVALRHAAGHDQPCPRPPKIGQFEHGVDGLLPGRLDEGAGVDHDQIGLGRIRGATVALTRQTSLQLVRVNLVLGAPQSLQPVPTLDHSFSSQPAGAATVTGHGAPAGADTSWFRHFTCPIPRAEREGFEPSDPVTQVNSLAVNPIRPLSHLSQISSLGHPALQHLRTHRDKKVLVKAENQARSPRHQQSRPLLVRSAQPEGTIGAFQSLAGRPLTAHQAVRNLPGASRR